MSLAGAEVIMMDGVLNVVSQASFTATKRGKVEEARGRVFFCRGTPEELADWRDELVSLQGVQTHSTHSCSLTSLLAGRKIPD